MKLLDWFFAARPMLHLPVWSIFLVTFEYHRRLTDESFGITQLLTLVVLSCLAGGAYYINNLFDEETDDFNNKGGFLQRKILGRSELWVLYVAVTISGLTLAWCISRSTLTLALMLAAMGWMYSAPPFRLKDRPVAGLFANGFSYGILVPFAVMTDLRLGRVGLLGWDTPIYFYFVVCAIFCLTTITDAPGDSRVNKRTIAVALGQTGSLVLAALFLLLATITAYASVQTGLVGLAAFGLALTTGALMLPSDRTILLATKSPILAVTLFAGFFSPFYLLFLVVLFAVTRAYYRRRFNMIYPRLI